MARMIDQIRTGGKLAAPYFVSPRFQGEWKKTARFVHQIVGDPQVPVLVIDNVSDYYYTGTDQEHWDLRKDFPNLAPPYRMFWAEHRLPRRVHSAECGDTDMSKMIGPHARAGVFVCSLDPGEVRGDKIPPATKWILWCELFIDFGHDRDIIAWGPHGSIFLAIDEQGALLDAPSMQSFTPGGDPETEELMKGYITWLYPTFLAISFLHCKNVKVEDCSMPKPLAKKFRAKHGSEPARWKTLVIEPLKEILRHEGRAHEQGLAKAMHICRGHFRDYREGRGLFGKYHQLVWQPSIIRGTKGKPEPREVEVRLPR